MKKTYYSKKKTSTYSNKQYWLKELYNETKYKFKYRSNHYKSNLTDLTSLIPSGAGNTKVSSVMYLTPFENPFWLKSGGMDPDYDEDMVCQDKLFIRGGRWTVDIARECSNPNMTPSQPLRLTMWMYFNRQGVPPKAGSGVTTSTTEVYTPESDPKLKHMIKGKWHKDIEIDVGREIKLEFKIKPELITKGEWWDAKKGFPYLVVHVKGSCTSSEDKLQMGCGSNLIFTKIYERIICYDCDDCDLPKKKRRKEKNTTTTEASELANILERVKDYSGYADSSMSDTQITDLSNVLTDPDKYNAAIKAVSLLQTLVQKYNVLNKINTKAGYSGESTSTDVRTITSKMGINADTERLGDSNSGMFSQRRQDPPPMGRGAGGKRPPWTPR